MTRRRRAVFLDRDGVLNRAVVKDGRPYPPASIAEMEVMPDARRACAALQRAGFLLILVTNQPDIARGRQTAGEVNGMNRRLQSELRLDDLWVCPHDDADGCGCRKPLPGLLKEAANRWDIDLNGSFMVGDRWRDVEAGKSAGCRSIFIDAGYREKRPAAPDFTAINLGGAAEWILRTSEERSEPVSTHFGLRIKIFADGANLPSILELARNPWIQGFTTNPTLMRQAGVSDYEAFAREVIAQIPDRPISFEVFSDEFAGMERQALRIASWGDNVYVKVPVTNTRGDSANGLLRSLARRGVKLNVTALMTLAQVRSTVEAISEGPASYISVFAGRIADTGRDPLPVMTAAIEALKPYPRMELIWASPRELLNIVQADTLGCHIITVTLDLLKKLPLIGKDLGEFSLETVRMFYDDARSAGFSLDTLPVESIYNLAEALREESPVAAVVPVKR